MGCHTLLQGLFPTQGLNSGLPHCRRILYHLIYQRCQRILEWVANPFSTPHTPYSLQLYSPWNSPDQNIGVHSLSLLQGIFPTQGSNPGLPHCRRILYHLSNWGSPRILEWVAYLFSRGATQPGNLGSPALQAHSLPAEPPGKPTGYS